MTHYKQRMSVEITAERLRYLLHYDPETGVFRWRVSTSHRMPVGSVAGANSHGYTTIGIDGRRYVASNLAWLYVTGDWPITGIDHRDQDKSNNRWGNLRLADQSQNNANSKTRRDSTSGVRGVSWDKEKGKWEAHVGWKGRKHHVGYFDSIEEASKARDAKALQLHGAFVQLNSQEYLQ